MWETLTYLARTYFHQDYQCEYETPADALRDFRTHENRGLRDALLADIDGALESDATESGLCDLWATRCRSSYLPEYDNLSCRQWFEQMRAILLER